MADSCTRSSRKEQRAEQPLLSSQHERPPPLCANEGHRKQAHSGQCHRSDVQISGLPQIDDLWQDSISQQPWVCGGF